MAVSQPIAGNISGTANLTVVAGGSGGQANVLPITVNGSLCSSGSYPNKPCVSVTVCTPGTSNCQTITDILLDTGSYGLRIFNQALNQTLRVSLTPVASGSGQLAECVSFGDNSSEWGPVQMASVVLGGEPAVQIPIHVVNYNSFGGPPGKSGCTSSNSIPDTSPSEAGFNGILGVGLMVQDCGTNCTSSSINVNPQQYYACNGSACSWTAVSLANQVQNPVAMLPANTNGVADNNGVIVELPGIGANGAASVDGSLVLGIGTQSDNTPSRQVAAYSASVASGTAEFTTSTSFGGTSSASLIDSGSNALYFYDPNLPLDSSGTWYCPASTTQLSATNTGSSGSPSATVTFQVGNYNSFHASSYSVFNLGGYSSFDEGFDWGLPFFLGRNVFMGFEGMQSNLGTGPYWAY
ncbi:MAG: DUF3443 family protein [Oryzomonas sp.]|nr:DUF3443 family protein [Oryzomonas sp.]MDR3579357.1 DUF3443 family protein [Oryzomonas sp.]